MSVLLDTNILTRLSQQSHPHHAAAKWAISTLKTRGESLFIVPQNLYEFWTVVTRPIGASNGLGFTIPQAKAEVTKIRSLFALLPDTPAVYTEWERLVEVHEVKGKTTHDARLVAAMIAHGLEQMLSFNDSDFSRYTAIGLMNPLIFAK